MSHVSTPSTQMSHPASQGVSPQNAACPLISANMNSPGCSLPYSPGLHIPFLPNTPAELDYSLQGVSSTSDGDTEMEDVFGPSPIPGPCPSPVPSTSHEINNATPTTSSDTPSPHAPAALDPALDASHPTPTMLEMCTDKTRYYDKLRQGTEPAK